MRFIAILLVGICLMMISPARGEAQSLLSVLDLGMGARPWGMGGAFTGLADDENALLYNAAALAYLEGARVGALYERRFGVVNSGSGAFAAQNLGLGLFFLNISGIPQQEGREPTGTFSYSNLAVIGAFGLPLSVFPGLAAALPGDLAVGLRAKFLRVNTLEGGQGSAWAIDPAFLMSFPLALGRVRVGAVIDNLLGLGITYSSGHAEGWRRGLRLGASLATAEGLTVALDLDTSGTLHVGSEFQLRGLGLETLGLTGGGLAVRFGSLMGKQFAPTLGLSLAMDNIRIDYAFISHSKLPVSHRLSFGMAFEMAPLLPFLSTTRETETPPEDPADDPPDDPPDDPCDPSDDPC